MIRLLIFFLWVVFFAAIATALLWTMNGAFSVEAFGWRFDLPAGAAFIIAIIATAIFAVLISTAKDLINAPKRARAHAEIRRREAGLNAVTSGLKSIAAGDASGARKNARIASKALHEAPVTKLLAAQAAQLSGDDAAAGEALAALLETPETEFLALRGLYAKARRDGDAALAKTYARRGFALYPGARWAFDGVFEAALVEGDWNNALMALEKAAGAGAIEKEKSRRGEAALAAASAYEHASSGEKVSAQQKAEASLNLSPGFSPAAVLLAKLHADDGRLKKAEKVLQKAFAAVPSPAIIESLLYVLGNATNAEKAVKLDRLAEQNMASREGVCAAARARIFDNEPDKAIALLEPVAEESLSANVAFLLADALEKNGDRAGAHAVLRLAAVAPRESEVRAASFFHLKKDDWRRVVLDFLENGRIAPPSLDGLAPGLAREEFLRLAGPPIIDMAETSDLEQQDEISDPTETRSGFGAEEDAPKPQSVLHEDAAEPEENGADLEGDAATARLIS
ncbi:MAG: heme biosynthesis HemY N-terminal domain-containing protein [Parvularculaceae bacterium]